MRGELYYNILWFALLIAAVAARDRRLLGALKQTGGFNTAKKIKEAGKLRYGGK